MSEPERKTPKVRKEATALAGVDVPYFGETGEARGTRRFSPGPVRNFPNIALLKEAVRRLQGRARRGTADTKGRSEIAGSNKKPWRQKGTGRARAGSRKSPIWRGGGTVFGPTPRDYDYGLPKKQRQLANRHALLGKLVDGETRVIERLAPAKPDAGKLRSTLDAIGVEGSVLIGYEAGLDKTAVRNLVLSCRNLRKVKVLPLFEADVLSMLKHKTLLVTAAAFDELQKRETGLTTAGSGGEA